MDSSVITPVCPYCWGSHGCDLLDGHDGDHECRSSLAGPCSTRPRGHSDVFNAFTDEPEAVTADGYR